MAFESVGLVGVGRFGRMVYSYLRGRKSLRVYDRDPEKVADLAEAASFREAVSARAVVLCVPISALESVCRQMEALVQPGQIVIDTCSVKQRPIEWMLQHLPESVEILGTHPLFGPDSGKEGVAGLKIAVCPARVSNQTYEEVKQCLDSLQLIAIETTPEEHDRQIARSQAVFHLIAQAMKNLGWSGQAISTPGPETFYRLVRTVQHDTDQLFRDMERENPCAEEYRRQFIEEISRLNEEISDPARRGKDT